MEISEEIKQLCDTYKIKPARSRGQNFLISEEVYDRIVEIADLRKDDVVLEVGPGLGFLTERLAKKVKKVVAVELDDKLAVVLALRLKEQGLDNVEIINEDILQLNMTNPSPSTGRDLINSPLERGEGCVGGRQIHPNPFVLRSGGQAGGECLKYKVVANLPYNITSIFLRKFLSGENRPQSMTLLLQKEVAERIVAKPGKMSVLAISVQYYAESKIIDYVGKEKFWPAPEVNSAIIKIDLKQNLAGNVDKEKDFFRLVKIGFSSRRKMLKNNLMAGYKISQEIAKDRLKSAGLDEKIRAQDLSVVDWKKLFVQFG